MLQQMVALGATTREGYRSYSQKLLALQAIAAFFKGWERTKVISGYHQEKATANKGVAPAFIQNGDTTRIALDQLLTLLQDDSVEAFLREKPFMAFGTRQNGINPVDAHVVAVMKKLSGRDKIETKTSVGFKGGKLIFHHWGEDGVTFTAIAVVVENFNALVEGVTLLITAWNEVLSPQAEAVPASA